MVNRWRMIFVEREITDPYFNLAAEEYIFRNFSDEVTMFWINDPCIIVGKHQNALAEINMDFVRRHQIPVIRRITGGGAVYHDHGNLNYTFIRFGKKGAMVDYEKQTRPIIEALKTLSVDARLEGKSNLSIKGLKFSGNSEHVHKNRVLHHGTLLFDSNLERLDGALKIKHQDYQDKGVRSIRSQVTNIIDHLDRNMSVVDFRDFLIAYCKEANPAMKHHQLTAEEIHAIRDLAGNKYKTWNWNFGYSPRYSLHRRIEKNRLAIEIVLHINHGRIEKINIKSNKIGHSFSAVEDALTGIPHEENAIRDKLININFEGLLKVMTTEDLIHELF